MSNGLKLTLHARLTIAIALLGFLLIESAPLDSLVTSLPGYEGNFPSKHYSGYVILDENHAKHMFYYFVESERNSTNDPVVLWLNGGPGCSSFNGFATEHGPFIFEATSGPFTSKASSPKAYLPKLSLNLYSWSKVSNIIYVDSPVGVGLSYSPNISDYNTGDMKTASDLHTFLLKWFEMFPEYVGSQFYIAGESYAGVYVPTLASEIMKGLGSGLRPAINLKGYLIGNGVTEEDSIDMSPIPYAFQLGFITDELYQEYMKLCPRRMLDPKCEEVIMKFMKMTDGLDPYDVSQPCYNVQYDKLPFECTNCIEEFDGFDISDYKSPRSFGRLRQRKLPHSAKRRTSVLNQTPLEVASNISTLCDGDLAPFFWFNDEAVRKAIHAANVSVSGKWLYCTNGITYHRDAGGMIKYHKMLTSMGLRVLIYSGDQDMIVPQTYSKAWLSSLGYKIVDQWQPWISNEQTAGYTMGYDKNLTFLTVKGAGHMVPSSKPREALDFYSRWLAGKKV